MPRRQRLAPDRQPNKTVRNMENSSHLHLAMTKAVERCPLRPPHKYCESVNLRSSQPRTNIAKYATKVSRKRHQFCTWQNDFLCRAFVPLCIYSLSSRALRCTRWNVTSSASLFTICQSGCLLPSPRVFTLSTLFSSASSSAATGLRT